MWNISPPTFNRETRPRGPGDKAKNSTQALHASSKDSTAVGIKVMCKAGLAMSVIDNHDGRQ